jgi:hypothetical protein
MGLSGMMLYMRELQCTMAIASGVMYTIYHPFTCFPTWFWEKTDARLCYEAKNYEKVKVSAKKLQMPKVGQKLRRILCT